MINLFTAKVRFLKNPIINVIAFVALEYIIESLYRALVGKVWRVFHLNTNAFNTNAFIGAWVGEGCFFAAAVTTITILSQCRKTSLSLYRGPAIAIVVGAATGITLGMILVTAQVISLHHLGWYMLDDGPDYDFPFTKELINCLAVAVTEETVFRGYLFPVLRKGRGTGFAVWVTSALFALAHLSNLTVVTFSKDLFYMLASTFSVGLLLVLCIVATGRIWLSIGVHFSIDFFLNLFYGDDAVGVSPLVSSQVYVERLNQSSIILYVVCDLVLLILALQRSKWNLASET